MSEVPFEYRIWSIKDCAEYLGYEPRYFRDQVRYREGFPAELPCGKRWMATEVVAWATGRKVTPNSRQDAVTS